LFSSGQESCVSVVYAAELVAFEAAVEALLGTDLRDVPGVHRLGNQQRLLEIRNKLDAVELHNLQRLDADEIPITETGRNTRSWLIEEQYLNPGEASKRTRLARALVSYPNVDAALSAGRISAEHALVIVKALASVPPEFLDTGEVSLEHANAIVRATAAVAPEFREIVETTLVDIARHCPACELGEEIEKLLIACGAEPAGDQAHVKRMNRRGLRIARTFNGMRSVSGMLTPEVAEALEIALGVLSAKAGADDTRTHEQRRHDAVGELANHYLTHADLPAVNGERPRVVVTIDYDALVHDLANAWGHLPSGATVSPATARRLACDAELIPAVLNARGDVLDIAVASRSFTTAIRRAAWLEQHGKCAFPGCRRPPADCHHIIWWSKGGPSTLDNAAWLCAFHHWLIHEGRWTLRRDPDRSFVFTGPDGQQRRRPRDP
jgi:hypothetical protein